MVIERSGLYWAEIGPAIGSRPAKHRPVLVIQGSSYDESRWATVLIAVVTSNTALATIPGNTFLPAVVTGLPRDSVVNVAALAKLDKTDLKDWIGTTPQSLMTEVDRGLRRVPDL